MIQIGAEERDISFFSLSGQSLGGCGMNLEDATWKTYIYIYKTK